MSAFAEYFALQNALLGVPMFDGKNPDLRTFVQDLESADLKVPVGLKPSFIQNVLTRLRDKARVSVENKNFTSIADLVSHLKAEFSPVARSFESYFSELGRAKMERNETVSEFGSRLQHIVRQTKVALLTSIPADDVGAVTNLVNKTALKTFLKGLRPDLELRVSLKNPETLDSAIELAKEYSLYLQDAAEHRGEHFHSQDRNFHAPELARNRLPFPSQQMRYVPPRNDQQFLSRRPDSVKPQGSQENSQRGFHNQPPRSLLASECQPPENPQNFSDNSHFANPKEELNFVNLDLSSLLCSQCKIKILALDLTEQNSQSTNEAPKNDNNEPTNAGPLNLCSARLRISSTSVKPKQMNALTSTKLKAGSIPKRSHDPAQS